jgi:CubicO group peptidase (beta-lactamase class C family)
MRLPTPSLDRLDPGLRLQCEAILSEGQVPGASIGIVMAGQAYHLSYGVKSLRSGAPVTPDTAFNIGSCSKAFVSATLASLVAEGLCSWDDPISRYVPEFQLYDPAITAMATLRDLSANRLGLSRMGLTEEGLDPRFSALELFARLKHTPPAFPFRSRFGYVNAGHAANALAAGRITGKGFLPTLRERILAPLGMTGTSGGAVVPDELPDRADWHAVLEGRAVPVESPFTDQYLGSGSILVSGHDALQWLRLQLGGGHVDGRQIIPTDALAETHRPLAPARPGQDFYSLFYPRAHMAAYALGWAVSDFEGHPLVMHSGSEVGITGMTLLLPRSGIGMVVYCNAAGGRPSALALAHALAATLLGLPPRDWLAYFDDVHAPSAAVSKASRGVASPADVSACTGSYFNPGDGMLDIWLEGDRLVGHLRDAHRWRFVLEPLGNHGYAIQFEDPAWRAAVAKEDPILRFVIAAGQASQVRLQGSIQGRVQDRCFVRDFTCEEVGE